MADNRATQFATPEKVLLDLLYLYPFYDSEQELEELQSDKDYEQRFVDGLLRQIPKQSSSR